MALEKSTISDSIKLIYGNKSKTSHFLNRVESLK